ncbi:MAG: ABC transporter permease [Bacteriovoracia bacterium]
MPSARQIANKAWRWLLLAGLAAFVLLPILSLFAQVRTTDLEEIAASTGLAKVMHVTLISALGGSLISLFLGVIFARQFGIYQWRGKRWQRLMLLIPYLVPNFILASAYVTSWNPATGLLNPVTRFPFGLYGVWGMTFLFGVTHVPVAFLLLEDKLKRMDMSLREAARLSGARSFAILWRIDLPLLRPTLLSALGLCFALNLSAFAIPAWIGAPEKAFPLTYKIYQQIQLGGAEGIPSAAAYSLILFLLTLPPLALNAWAQRDSKKYALVSGKAARVSDLVQKPGKFAAFQGFFWISQLFIWIGPLFALLASTLVKPGCLQSSGLACFEEVSLRSYHYVLFELAETRVAFYNSLVYGTLAAACILAICIAALFLFSRLRGASRAVEWVFGIPVATPGAIIALGLIVVYSGQYGINLYNTPWIVVVALILKHLNLAYQPLRTGMANISQSLFEAAELSGARGLQVWSRVVLPILRPECVGGFFLVLVPILGELTMSIFLASPGYRSIGTVLFDLQDYADQASAGALSVLLVLMILIVNELTRWLSRGKLGY